MRKVVSLHHHCLTEIQYIHKCEVNINILGDFVCHTITARDIFSPEFSLSPCARDHQMFGSIKPILHAGLYCVGAPMNNVSLLALHKLHFT